MQSSQTQANTAPEWRYLLPPLCASAMRTLSPWSHLSCFLSAFLRDSEALDSKNLVRFLAHVHAWVRAHEGVSVLLVAIKHEILASLVPSLAVL